MIAAAAKSTTRQNGGAARTQAAWLPARLRRADPRPRVRAAPAAPVLREWRRSFCRRDVEAEHHSALVMLGDMAMRHPDPRVRYVEQDVDRLTSPHEHRVLPHQVLLFGAVARKNDKAAGAMDMEGMVHRVIGIHLVDEPQLHLVADDETPVDRMVGGSRLSVDKAPVHVCRRRNSVDIHHVVFPFDATSLALLLVAVVAVVAVGLVV